MNTASDQSPSSQPSLEVSSQNITLFGVAIVEQVVSLTLTLEVLIIESTQVIPFCHDYSYLEYDRKLY